MLRLRQFINDLSGATAIEYGLVAALVSVALITGFGALSNNVNNTLLTVDNAIVSKAK